MFTRRKFLVQTGSTLAVSLGAAQLAQAATVGGWAQQQGGSQDLQTGLVWLDWTLANGSLWSHPGAGTQAAACTAGGVTGWRLPTRAEMTTAVSDGIALTPESGIPNCPLMGTPSDKYMWWSSTLGTTKGGKAAYAMDMRTGSGEFKLIQSKLGSVVSYTYALAIFVRQGF